MMVLYDSDSFPIQYLLSLTQSYSVGSKGKAGQDKSQSMGASQCLIITND